MSAKSFCLHSPSSGTFPDIYPAPRLHRITHIQGCLFHFCQLQRKRFKFPSGIASDEILDILLWCFYGLPFVPLADIGDAFAELKEKLLTLYPIPESERYVSYFETNWLRGPAAMSPDQRNVNATVEYGEPRTNNASEGGNNSLNHTTSATRPAIWTCSRL